LITESNTNFNAVPVYDGRIQKSDRGGFMSTDYDWDRLKDLPRYQKGGNDCEVPIDALVVVGYTASTYVGASGNSQFSSNIQFVIVLSDCL
jgi:hypothetical protein